MGAVAENVYTDKNYDLTIISHVEPLDIGIYAKPGYYFNYDNADFNAIIARLSTAPDIDAYKMALVEAQHKLATTASTRSCSSCECRRRGCQAARPLEGRADLRQRSFRAFLEVMAEAGGRETSLPFLRGSVKVGLFGS